MGNLISNDTKENIEQQREYKLDDLLCYKCGEIPEIKYVHTDNNKIELKCKKCGEYEIRIDKYYEELSKNNYFRKCKFCQKNENKYYCYDCMSDLCEECKNKDNPKKHNKEHKSIIILNKKKDYCPKHSKKFKSFCNDCMENFCDEKLHIEHKGHDIMGIIPEDEIYEEYYNYIQKTNEDLKIIVNFNELVMNTEKLFKNNYFHKKSIINLGKSYEDSNKRDSNEVKYLLKGLSMDSQKLENAKKKINITSLNRKDKSIYLKDDILGDQVLKYMSQIRFNQLKEINISEKKITNLEPFNLMSLPFLEYLNLSHNNIERIEPISSLDSKNLKHIFLQNNNIRDIGTLLNADFPKVEILRIEENNINEQESSVNKLKKKYKKNNVIMKSFEKQKEEFEKNYKKISEKDNKIDLSDLKGGEEMLKYLFLILTYKTENNLNELILRGNKIKDPSMLSRINLGQLKLLDLAVNKITNLDFLLDMNAENLETLYLDNNCINDINQIITVNFKNLRVLSLNENNFFDKDMEINDGCTELKRKKEEEEKKIKIQLVKPDENYYKDLIDEYNKENNFKDNSCRENLEKKNNSKGKTLKESFEEINNSKNNSLKESKKENNIENNLFDESY